jgi:Nif-specific regulatory protein
MSAVLVGTGGPARGKLLPLGGGDLTIGRDASNAVSLDDLAASRRHCVIRSHGDRFQLVDLQSRNGTFVNGSPARECWLEDWDEIRVGSSLFLFRRAAAADLPAEEETGEILPATRSSAARRPAAASVYLDPARLGQRRPPPHVVRGLQVLLQLSQVLQVAQTLDALKHRLLKTLLEALPARRGAILLAAPDGSLESSFAWDAEKDSDCSVRIPPDVFDQVVREHLTVVADYEADTPGISRQTIAVPLTCFEQPVGVLYVETSAAAAGAGAADPDLITAVGAIAGLAIHNLLRVERLRAENQRLQSELRLEHDMIGESPAMHAVHEFIGRVAATDSTVLIGGESGTGKELVARAIHRNSARVKGPFVAVNCAALTESLLEDELFGHERGAFTGAVAMKKGRFEVAEGGTLFLDEIGELAPALQTKLLRVLQTREFERVGGVRTIKTDVRVVAATNRDLAAAIRAGQFRQDLYFRLNVLSVTVPPLRERREDIPLLARYFAAKFCQKLGKRCAGISPKAIAALLRHDWPGNVRELENAIERAVVLGASEEIMPEDLPETIFESGAAAAAGTGGYQDAVVEAKRKVVREALERANGVYTEAARLLDMHPNYLHRLVKTLGLR